MAPLYPLSIQGHQGLSGATQPAMVSSPLMHSPMGMDMSRAALAHMLFPRSTTWLQRVRSAGLSLFWGFLLGSWDRATVWLGIPKKPCTHQTVLLSGMKRESQHGHCWAWQRKGALLKEDTSGKQNADGFETGARGYDNCISDVERHPSTLH